MGKRGASTQHRHDQKVASLAKGLQNKGYNVKADVKGFEKPKIIQGRRPDIIAKKGSKEKIIEVETPKTLNIDKQQHKVFDDYADRGNNRSFDIKVAK